MFGFRGILRWDEATIALPAEAGRRAAALLPFRLQIDASGTEVATESDADGSVRVEADSVPSSVYALEASEGWDTVVYDSPDRVIFYLAYPQGVQEFLLSPVDQLDQEQRMRMIGFTPSPMGGQTVLRTEAVPCPRQRDAVDRVTFTFSEGFATFYTRPALWGFGLGFTVLAVGEVDGISFEVDSYWDLEYSTGDFALSQYGVSPTFAVRFDVTAEGGCVLVVEPDETALEEAYTARLLDCEFQTLRQLNLESIDISPV